MTKILFLMTSCTSSPSYYGTCSRIPKNHVVGSDQAISSQYCFSRYFFGDVFVSLSVIGSLQQLYSAIKSRFEKIRASQMTVVEFGDVHFSNEPIAKAIRSSLPKCRIRFIGGGGGSFQSRYRDPGFLVDPRRMIGDGVIVENNNQAIACSGGNNLRFDHKTVTILASPSGTGKTITALLLRPEENRSTTVCVYIVMSEDGDVTRMERLQSDQSPSGEVRRERQAFKVLLKFLTFSFYVHELYKPTRNGDDIVTNIKKYV